MEQKFIRRSDNCAIDTIVGDHVDSLYVRVDRGEPRVTFSIENGVTSNSGPEQEANYLFYGDTLQKLFDWLKQQGVVK